MGFYEDVVLPRAIDVVLGRPFEETRARVTSDLSGEVLEVGFGTGRNVPHYPAAVTRVLAVDPATRARRIAAGRVDRSAVPVEYVGLDGEYLPVADDSMDHVLVTWTLCTIPDVERALAEIVRVLRPAGSLRFVEHGRSPRPRVSRRQDQLTPAWGKIAGGCHLNRPIEDLVRASGLSMTELRTYHVPRTGPFGFMYEGAAVKQPTSAAPVAAEEAGS
ncbi:MAG: class I SAM-dependent methyltransferase [Jatrophihabitans sp.]